MQVTSANTQLSASPQGTAAETAQIVPNAKSSALTPQSLADPNRDSVDPGQYFKAIGMSSADLGAILAKPTERITEKLGNAITHEKKAKAFRQEAQHEFDQNIAFYYEAKQRLLNPG